jgi:uncharacterized protein involved in tolerance to divalent cations
MYPIGTEVQATHPYDNPNIIGIKGKIISIGLTNYGIEFDKHIEGHSCSGQGKPGHCWWIPKKYVKPIDKHQQMYFKMLEEVM